MLGLLFVFPATAAAQEPHHPEISIAHRGIAQLKTDIKLMLDLATQEEQHWENWDGVIELFAFGLDYDRPIRVDVLSGLTPPPFMVYGPYDSVDDLLHENLESADYVPQKVSDTLYELLPPERGWFRVLGAEKYAILTLSTGPTHSLLKQLILKCVNPIPIINQVLRGGANIGVQLVNKAQTQDDQNKRKASFADTRAERMGIQKKRPQETATQFEIRKGLLSVYLDELERLMVEASSGLAQAALDSKTLAAKLTFEGEGIKGTSLANSIDLIGKSIDAFASVKKPADSVLSLRINHPVDDLRKKNVAKMIELFRADVESRLKSSDNKLSAAEKTASQQVFDGAALVISDVATEGNLNGFVESVPNKAGKFVTWGGMVAKDAKRLDATIALLSKTGEGNSAEIEVASANGVDIHSIKLRKGFLKIYDDIIGNDNEFYIGTSESMVWFGAGPGSLKALTASIKALKEPSDSNVVLKIDAELSNWVRRAQEIVKAKPEPTDLDQQQVRREVLLRLQQANTSLKETDDDIQFEMSVNDGKASGVLKVNTGLLRFVGTQLETFSKNSLQ